MGRARHLARGPWLRRRGERGERHLGAALGLRANARHCVGRVQVMGEDQKNNKDPIGNRLAYGRQAGFLLDPYCFQTEFL